jgi:ABC-type lipoprotein export system ATPase subunit
MNPEALCTHLEDHCQEWHAAAVDLVTQARAEMARRADHWQPIARLLGEWLGKARRARAGADQIPMIKAAEKFLKAASADIRNQRFAPIAAEAKSVWGKLSRQSNVNLEDIVLAGTKTRRRVDLEVAVDGVNAAAVGVMSQGELHALALSLFLPRAVLAESPLHFVVIDDPVQSMDPARVDGLAQVLADTAETRQVVVFTHDDRLPESVRRMKLAATVIEVTRKPRSVVACRQARTPVQAHFDDAFALAKDENLAPALQAAVIPGLCRAGLEAFFVERVRAKCLAAGQNQTDVDDALAAANTLNKMAALALFDDVGRTGDVMQRLNQLGDWAGTTFQHCNKGAHGGYEGELTELVQRSENLVKRLGERP